MRAPVLLAPAACAAWVVAWALTGAPDPVPWVIAAWSATCIGLAVALVTRRSLPAAVAVTLALVAGVASAVGVGVGIRNPDGLADALRGGRAMSALVEVTSASSGRFAGTMHHWSSGGIEHPSAATVVVFASPPSGADIGALVRVEGGGRTTPPGDRAGVLLFPDRTRLVAAAPAPLAATAALRAGFRDLTAAMPGDGGGLLPGLAIGDTAGVGEALDRDMKTSSLSHLTAVSGANCAIVTAMALGAGTMLRLPRWARTLGALLALGGFVLLVTPEPSVLRASVMALVVLLTHAWGRPTQGVPVLALTVVVLLSMDPWLAREYGFVLSVLATGGLLLLAGPLGERMARWMPRSLALGIAMPLAAQLACQPVIVLLSPALSTYGVPANMLAAPAAPVATVLGALACVLLPIVPWLAVPLAWLAWLPASWIAAVARLSADLPGASLPWLSGLLGLIALAVLTALLLVAIFNDRRRRPASVALAVLTAVLVGATIGADAIARAGRPADWQFAACPVGQGDAMLVRSRDVVALIDTGPEPEPLEACLDDLGIGRLDVLVLTHYDRDHAGGAEALLGRVDTVLAGTADRAQDELLLRRLAEGGATVTRATAGLAGALGDLRWRVLWPASGSILTGNDGSVVMLFEPWGDCARRCLSGLFLADLGAHPQARLLASGVIGEVDVVKVSHHGSADQHPELYQRAGASIGMIGVGAGNGYGHPTDEALAMLRTTGAVITRTDRDGLVLIAPGAVSAGAGAAAVGAPEPRGGIRIWRQRDGGRD